MQFENGFKSDILNSLQKHVDKMTEKEKLCAWPLTPAIYYAFVRGSSYQIW